MRHYGRLMAIVAVAALVGACGGSKASESDAAKDDASSKGSTTTVIEGGAAGGADGKSTSATQKTPGGSTAKAGSPTSGGGDGNTPTSEAPKPPTPLEVSLKSTCVKAGGQQTITIKVVPGSGVGYNSYYPDGKTATMEGFYGGNNGKVVENQDGTWTDTWAIAPNAPAGKVRVAVLAGHEDYEAIDRDLFFDLVPPTGICP